MGTACWRGARPFRQPCRDLCAAGGQVKTLMHRLRLAGRLTLMLSRTVDMLGPAALPRCALRLLPTVAVNTCMPPSNVFHHFQVFAASHNGTTYAVKVLTGLDNLAAKLAAMSLDNQLLHRFEQVGGSR